VAAGDGVTAEVVRRLNTFVALFKGVHTRRFSNATIDMAEVNTPGNGIP